MGRLLTLGLLATGALGWFYPQIVTIVAGAAWIVLFIIVYVNNRITNFTSSTGILTEAEAELTSKYGFYFRNPHLSVAISNGCAVWQMFSILWLGFLAYKQLWWFMLIPVAVFLICWYLRPTCHPGFFAQEGAQQFSRGNLGSQFASKEAQIQTVYDKLWGEKANRPEGRDK